MPPPTKSSSQLVKILMDAARKNRRSRVLPVHTRFDARHQPVYERYQTYKNTSYSDVKKYMLAICGFAQSKHNLGATCYMCSNHLKADQLNAVITSVDDCAQHHKLNCAFVHGQVPKCHDCSITFNTRQAWKHHMLSQHLVPDLLRPETGVVAPAPPSRDSPPPLDHDESCPLDRAFNPRWPSGSSAQKSGQKSDTQNQSRDCPNREKRTPRVLKSSKPPKRKGASLQTPSGKTDPPHSNKRIKSTPGDSSPPPRLTSVASVDPRPEHLLAIVSYNPASKRIIVGRAEDRSCLGDYPHFTAWDMIRQLIPMAKGDHGFFAAVLLSDESPANELRTKYGTMSRVEYDHLRALVELAVALRD